MVVQSAVAAWASHEPVSQVRSLAPGRGDLLEPGELIAGTFEVRRKIGHGGMGQVYEAYDRTLARRVAIKIAVPDPARTALREARALAALKHPGIVSVHSLVEHEGMPCVVMELLLGRTLGDVLDEHRAKGTRTPISEAVDLLAAIADGLAVVHRAGMAHRDVKPANVMLAPGGRVVLTDFGLFEPENTSRASFGGSPHYLAPEVLQSQVALGEQFLVDVYALGVVAYEMLTGSVPFDDAQVLRIMVMHVSECAPDPAVKRGAVPRALSTLVLDMLAKDPKSRPQSMDEIAWRLRHLRRTG